MSGHSDLVFQFHWKVFLFLLFFLTRRQLWQASLPIGSSDLWLGELFNSEKFSLEKQFRKKRPPTSLRQKTDRLVWAKGPGWWRETCAKVVNPYLSDHYSKPSSRADQEREFLSISLWNVPPFVSTSPFYTRENQQKWPTVAQEGRRCRRTPKCLILRHVDALRLHAHRQIKGK